LVARKERMNDLRELRDMIGGGVEATRLGTVHSILDDQRLEVAMDVGGFQYIVGTASKGDRVLVKGGLLFSRMASGAVREVKIA